jgi:vancomycin permeability regulator SanA
MFVAPPSGGWGVRRLFRLKRLYGLCRLKLVTPSVTLSCNPFLYPLIHLDYAGFRTYDSVYRLRDIFGQESFTVISQRFHNQRAIYIAKRLGMEAIGYNAKNVDSYSGFKTNTREKFARVKVFIDLLINKKPKFLGEKIEI